MKTHLYLQLLSSCHLGMAKLGVCQTLTVAGKEGTGGKYKIKAVLPASCSAHFVVLFDMKQVQAAGWEDVMTAGF